MAGSRLVRDHKIDFQDGIYVLILAADVVGCLNPQSVHKFTVRARDALKEGNPIDQPNHKLHTPHDAHHTVVLANISVF